jgi:hypothetical protein
MNKLLRTFDPFDNIGLYMSPVKGFMLRHLASVMMALACVAIAMLPAGAMPVFSAKTGVISHFIVNKIGTLGTVGAVMGATTAPQKRPFRYGTVKRRIEIGNFAVNPGNAIPSIVLPQVGMLAKLVVDVEGSYTKANATGLNLLDGFDALLSRARVGLNNGSQNLVDLSGVGVNIVNRDLSPALPIKRGLATAAGAQTFSYKFVLPINANDRRQFEMGLINLQAPEVRCTCDLVFNPIASVFATAADVTNFAATAQVAYEYYEIPDLNQYMLPPLTIVRTIEEAPAAINAVGLQLYQIPRLGTMIDYHAVVVLNNVYGAVLTAVSEFAIRYNKSDVQYDVLMGNWETYEALNYGIGQGNTRTSLFTGALSFNLWSAGDRSWNGGDFRDAIDTEENTTTEALITIAAGQALNAGKDNIFHVRRVVQRIVAAPAPTR